MTEATGENRLARETSPYLLQHKDNPVHWWAWGPDALAEAKKTGKPILLSVGYAACHWCHVMAHESFEDEATARLMNGLFVNIKVDREERPDIDAIYMAALHRLDEHGGWPLTMFLDSDARPFFGGTYFPPEQRWGKPAFSHVLREIARIYREEPEKVSHNAGSLSESLKPASSTGARAAITDEVLADLTAKMVRAVDPVHGGLQGAPKFPQWNFFWLLWRGAIRYGNAVARTAVENTLTHICQGGIYDHLGGGFSRYSVDARWLAPHFEKMLYDNALLIDLMTEVWRETRNPLFKSRIEETVAWLEREMIADGGGFAASLDADSEGEEGKFYVWSVDEVAEVLGPDDAPEFAAVYDLTGGGNWEGHTILNRLHTLDLRQEAEEARLAGMRAKLLSRRDGRIRPGWDDKVLADWNGLMIAALVHAGRVFERPSWFALAARAFDFVSEKMTVNGRLMHSARAGQVKAPATASDYANMIWGTLRLYQATNEDRYLAAARGWAGVLDRHYWDAADGGYFMTADDTPDVIVRMKTAHDDATPNANAIMLTNLVQLFLLTGEQKYVERAEAIPHAFAADLGRSALGHTGLLANSMDLLAPQHIVVLSSADETELTHAVRGVSLPGAVEQVLISDGVATPPSPRPAPEGPKPASPAGAPSARERGEGMDSPSFANPALAGKTAIDGKPTAYVCIGPQCSPPVTQAARLTALLKDLRQARLSA